MTEAVTHRQAASIAQATLIVEDAAAPDGADGNINRRVVRNELVVDLRR